MKKTVFAALMLAVVVTASGCAESILESKTSGGTDAELWTAADDDTVAWASGDLSDEDKEYYNIPFADFYSEYSFYVDINELDESDPDNEATLKSLRQQMIEGLANEKIVLKKAAEKGLDVLSDEEAAEVNEDFEAYLEQFYPKFEEEAQQALGDTSEVSDDELKAKKRELLNEYLEQFGLSEENFLKWVSNNYIYSKTIQDIGKDITVTEKEVEDYITSFTEEAKAAYEKSVSEYEAKTEYQAVWIPDGSREIKFILIAADSADAAELSAARTESGADTAELDKMRDEMLEKIKGQAEAALKKLQSGEADFDAVLKEYGANYSEDTEDPTTLVVYKSERTISELYEALYKLEKPGDISDLIPTDRGYYIIQYKGDAKITEENMEDVRQATEEGMIADKQQELRQQTVEQWQKEVGYEYDYDALHYDRPEQTESQEQSESE